MLCECEAPVFVALFNELPFGLVISRLADGVILYANERLNCTFGLSTEELIGRNTREFFWNSAQEQALLDALAGDGYVRNEELQIRRADGTPFWVGVSLQVLTFQGEQALLGIFDDITSRKRAEEEIQLLQTITQAITDTEDFNSALYVALCKVCESTGWDFGEAWIPRPDGTVLECSRAWYSSTPALEPFRQRSEALSFAPGVGLPGRVWLSGQPEWIPDVSADPSSSFVRNQQAKEYGLRAGFAVPIVTNNQVLAVLAFFMFESRQEDKRLVELVWAVAAQLGTVLQQKQAEAALRESQRRLWTLIDSLPGIVFSCANDPEWSMTYLSRGVLNLTGYKSAELIGNRAVSYDTITHPEDLPKVLEAIETSVASGQPYVVEYRIRTKSGQEKWVWEKGAAVHDPNGKVLGLEGFITDITDRKQAESSLRQASAKYRSIFENAIEGIFQTTPDGYYISANPALARIYGYSSPEELMARLVDIEHQLYVEPNRRAEFIRLLQEHDAVSEFESQVYRKDGRVIWISENARAVRDGTDALLYYEGRVEDITERKRTKEQLLHYAFYDTLTGLPNRALFMQRLRAAIERAKSSDNYMFAVLFLDLDRFKVVNDSLGHLVGDQLLVAIACRLEACVRSGDTVARLGGDEFTILLEHIEDISNATSVAERIQKDLRVPFYLDGHEVFTAASIGIVLSKSQNKGVRSQSSAGRIPHSPLSEKDDAHKTIHSYEQPEDLLRDADTALYRAKMLGKARHEVFDITMHDKAVTLLDLETDLRHAHERGEFQIHYQPLVSLTTGRIIGFEALLVWQHPIRGMVAPSEFIPVAEETGLIIPIGWWMLREACRQLKSWQLEFPGQALTLNVNLSAKQFSQADLLLQIDKILHETGLDGRNLMLEITESCLQQNAQGAISMLAQLRNRQIQLCIDDFGTGYSSVSFMHQLPINALKIDCSFVRQMGIDESTPPNPIMFDYPDSERGGNEMFPPLPALRAATLTLTPPRGEEKGLPLQIVKTIVMLAHNLGMEVIAEGVETAQQVNLLRGLGCEYAQGFFFSHPVVAKTALALIASTDAVVK